jgi:ornithine carbamoyltransferase
LAALRRQTEQFQRSGNLENIRVAWIGDGNNMANSWIEASIYFPFELCLAVPRGYDPDLALLERARGSGARVNLVRDPRETAAGANYVTTDVWASMGQEQEQQEREKHFIGYYVDKTLMDLAAPGAGFLHCLPAHRGEEVSEEVFESSASLVWDEAENRMHVQKAILEWVFTG